MNDKTEQALTDELRLAAKSAAPYGTARIGASHLIDAADTIDNLRAQLAEAQRELVAKEAERAAMELERNNAQRQHSMQCAINKTDSQRILELATQLAEAQRDAERFRFANESEEDFAICYWGENMGNGGEWMCYSDKGDAIEVLDAAIDAARGRA